MKSVWRKLFLSSCALLSILGAAGEISSPQMSSAGPYAPPAAMRLTAREAVALALRNNVDIAIQQYAPQLAEENIQYQRGIAYDPTLTLNATRRVSDQPTIIGAQVFPPILSSQKLFTSGLTGKIPLGTGYTLQANMSSYNGEWIGAVGVAELRQPLLKNFGLMANQAPIWIARKDKERTDYEFAQQVMKVVSDVQNAYYDLVFTIEKRRVQEEALTLARTLLAENKRKLEVGMLSPLEVTQAEAGVAKAESDLIVAQRDSLIQENILKLLISRDVYSLRKTRIEPAETFGALPRALDVDESIRQGLLNRPDYLAAKVIVEREKIRVRYTRNQAFPELDLVGSYTSNSDVLSATDAIDKIFKGKTPTWSAGIELRFPIPDRAPLASYRTARLNVLQALEQMKKAEQTVIVDVDNSIGTIQSNFKRVDATRNARYYAQESLKAEQTKFNAGTSTSFLVLQAQTQLTAARADEIRAISDYNKSVSDLARSEGTILKQLDIVLQPTPKMR